MRRLLVPVLFLIAALAVTASAAIVHRMPVPPTANGWIDAVNRIGTVSLLFGALYLAAVILLHAGFAPLRELASVMRDMLPQSGSRESAVAIGSAGMEQPVTVRS